MHPYSRGRDLGSRRLRSLLIGLVLGATSGCATVDEPDIVRAPTPVESVSPVLQDPGARGLKRKLIIARFSNETLYGKSVLLGDQASLVARQASDMLAARLTQTERFLLFERTDTESLLRALDEGTLPELGLPADLLVIGSLSEFGRRETSETGVFSRTKKQTTVARVNVRLVDVRSGQVLFAQEGAGEAESEVGTVLGVGTKAGYDSSLHDQAISAAVSKVVNELMENVLDRPWQSWVLAVEDGIVTIGGGASQGISTGDRLQLKRRGNTVRNPQTGAVIELPGAPVATLEVVGLHGSSPEEEIAMCRVVDGEAPPPGADDYSEYAVEELK